MTTEMIEGDCRDVLKELADQSVNCIVTSPPYFGLRDYGVENQMGLEPTPDDFVAVLVGVMREARRVLRDDGTLWLNLGDSYARDAGKGQHKPGDAGKQNYLITRGGGRSASTVNLRSETRGSSDGKVGRADRAGVRTGGSGLKEKDLIGIPWRVAFALQADGWYLRQGIIWHKPNPMPESVRDRCTKAHEYIFLLSKSPTYYFDWQAMQEPANVPEGAGNAKGNRYIKAAETDPKMRTKAGLANIGPRETRNKRSVWSVTTKPFKEAHFATFPPDLIEPCVLAGCPEGGTVLDPFFGAGTTGLVCQRTGRNAIGIELNPVYYDIAAKRLGLVDEFMAAE